MALTSRQRREILERDEYQSQFLYYAGEDKGWTTDGYCFEGRCNEDNLHLHVHHVQPQRILEADGLVREEIDDPRNLITTYQCQHTGICPDRIGIDGHTKYIGLEENLERPVIHPDIEEATLNYDGTRLSFDFCFELRDDAIQRGETYWLTDYDDLMLEIADERTRVAAAKGWQFHLAGT